MIALGSKKSRADKNILQLGSQFVACQSELPTPINVNVWNLEYLRFLGLLWVVGGSCVLWPGQSLEWWCRIGSKRCPAEKNVEAWAASFDRRELAQVDSWITFGADIAWTSSDVFFHRLVIFKVCGSFPLVIDIPARTTIIRMSPNMLIDSDPPSP